MKSRTVSRVVEARMALNLFGTYYKKFYKYSPDGLNNILLIDKNKEFLSSDLYSLPEELIFGKDGHLVSYLTKYLKNYRTIHDYLRLSFDFDKRFVADNVLKIVKELENIGLNFYDIHDQNFMIDDNGGFKVVDIDGVEVLIDDEQRMYTLNNYWDLVLEMFLFNKNLSNQFRLSLFCLFEELDTYFSEEFIEYMEGVFRDDYDTLSIDPAIYLPEFDDKEKVLELSSRLEDFRNYDASKGFRR